MNVFARSRARKGEYMRLGNMLLMLIFTLCALALMWTAVSCLNRISLSSESASDGLAAAQFAVNHIRRADGNIDIYCDENGSLDKMIISRNDGYENAVFFRNGSISEALVPQGMETSSGEEIFSVSDVKISLFDKGLLKITVTTKSGSSFTLFSDTSEEVRFFESGGAAQ